jgi:hypothetical protein
VSLVACPASRSARPAGGGTVRSRDLGHLTVLLPRRWVLLWRSIWSSVLVSLAP